jgi:hypothetical protein
MRQILGAIVAGGVMLSVGCGGGGTVSGGAGGSGSGGRAGQFGASGGSGGSSSASVFHLSGTVVRSLAALAPMRLDSAPLALDPPAPKTVTHVMAVNPSSQDPRRVLAMVAPNGSFSVDLAPGHPWVLVFVDSSRTGSDMIAGTFRASQLDTLAPMVPGSADLGMVGVANGTATGGIAYADLLTALHLSSDGADYLGARDDVCLRYVNPDVDGDGQIDLVQMDHDFQLDFHVQFAMRIGDAANPGLNATVADVVGAFLPDTTTIAFGGVGIYASYPGSFATVDAASAWAAFDAPIHYYPNGGGGPSGPTLAAAGVRIAGSDLNLSGYGSMQSEGVYAAAGFDLPQGQYQFGVGSTTLTFTNIRTHSDAQLAAAEDFIMPFVRIVPVDGCSGDCAVSGVEFKWMKHVTAGWVAATVEELDLVVNDQGGFISILKTFDNGDQHIGMTIPADVQTGVLPWTSATLENLTTEQLMATKASEICHFGLSYDDKLGMRMFSGIANAPGTCATR